MKMCSERYAVNLQENAHAWQSYQNHTLCWCSPGNLLHISEYFIKGTPLDGLLQ